MKILYASMIFVLLLVALFWGAVTWNYPMVESCAALKEFSSRYGKFPEDHLVEDVIKGVRPLSILRYRRTETGFSLHYCHTRFGPCEVCTESLDPHFEEI